VDWAAEKCGLTLQIVKHSDARRVRGAAARRGDLLVLGEGVDGADLLLRRGQLGDLTARAALGLVRRPTAICPAAA
jgi:hypothetical protein